MALPFYERPSLEESAKILNKNYYSFVHFNRQRKHILKTLVNPLRYEMLQLVPMLLHINDRRAPGYIPDLGQNPGLHGFTLNDELRALRKKYLSNRFTISVGASDAPIGVSLASIGSAGTLAQTEKSDFDLWLTLRNDVKPLVYHQMDQKAKAIIEFLMTIDPGLDMNIYLGTPEKVRAHNFGAVSDDSAGSALGKLLKEEFYRTCINWNGQTPIWWVLPEEVRSVEDYDWWVERIHELKPPYLEDLMDMGPIERASNSALLSAVLWQTNKSLGSPFKSLLKLSVVSRYCDEPDEIDTLADKVRRNVQLSPTMGRGTDPYLCLFEFAAQYWRNEQNDNAVGLMAEMFYLKMLSESSDRFSVQRADETMFRKRSEVRKLLNGWGLVQRRTRDLNNINNWSFEKSMKYRERTKRFVKFIFDRVMLKLEALGLRLEKGEVIRLLPEVDESAVSLLQEFSTISHKVDAFYGRSWIKVQPSPPSFRKMLHQQGFAIVGRSTAPKHVRWTLSEEVPRFDRKGPEDAKKDQDTNVMENQETYIEGMNPETLVQSRSPLHLVVWLACNKLLKNRSMLRVLADGTRRAGADVRRFVMQLAEFFEHPLYDDLFPESEFNVPPQPAKALVYFDLQRSGMFRFHKSSLEKRQESREEEQSSILNRGNVLQIAYAEQSTHGLVKVYDVPTKRFSIASIVARVMVMVDGKRKSAIEGTLLFEAANTKFHEEWIKEFRKDFERIHGLVSSVPRQPKFALRVITRINGELAMITRRGVDDYRGQTLSGVREVLKELETPLGMPVQTIVDPEAEGLERLRAMMKMWSPGQVRVFVFQRAQVSSIHVIDEAGGFYNERVPTDRLELETASIRAFIHALRHFKRPFLSGGSNTPMQFYKMRNDLQSQGGYHYSFEAMGGRDERLLDKVPILKVGIEGGNAQVGPIRVTTLTVSGQQHFFDVEGEGWKGRLALLLLQLMQRVGLADYSLAKVQLEHSTEPLIQTLSHLRQRRAIDSDIRQAINALHQAVEKRRATQVLEREQTRETDEVPI